jgi:hypothetical protein
VSKDAGRDDSLVEELRALLGRADPVPHDVTEFAQAALGWRRLDAELAELLADSALDTDTAALTRSGEGGRWLSFRSPDLAIEVEIQSEADVHSVLGQLEPAPAQATIEVQAADGTVLAAAEADELGRFRLRLAAGGRVRLRVLRRDPAGAPVESSWLTL